ncbi:uncharacterized protein LOC127723591 isoform X2 [Mytilus californianus]|uniref:uncharacterized protein LOC127723591 isoform X2 n=1 Tax=Mytilus californianus TaxID=6549 RepID=UPI00224763CB|nr:uncharacterized protein LOC127723591 isoform X2 [Mytilus californianus]
MLVFQHVIISLYTNGQFNLIFLLPLITGKKRSSSDMNPSVFYFYFPLLMLILQLAYSLRWKVEHKVTDYGQNLILLCSVSNSCLKDAGWYLWTPTKRTIFKDVKTTSLSAPPKYSGYVRTDGFTLIIKNLTLADMNVSYSCDYGLQLGDNIVLHKDDVFKNDRSGLSINVLVLIITGGSVLTIFLLAVVICMCSRTLSYEQVETDDPFKGVCFVNFRKNRRHWYKQVHHI